MIGYKKNYTEESQDLTIERRGNAAIVSSPAACFTYEVENIDPREIQGEISYNAFTQAYAFADGLELIPYGLNNNIPQLLRDTIFGSANIPGVMEKKMQLLWGQGPYLYRERMIDGKPGREGVHDADIQNWLESFDYLSYLEACGTDTSWMQGNFGMIVPQKSGLLGKKRVHSLEHCNPLWARLARKTGSSKATHAFISDAWLAYQPEGYKDYTLFDHKEGLRNERQIFYSRQYSFATDYYAVPTIYGALPWIKRSAAVPLILEALSKNSINVKYHIKSPAIFWDQKRIELQDKCAQEGRPYEESMLDDYERALFRSIIKTLSSDKNSGKIWHTKKLFSPDGANLTEVGWEIEAIDQNLKDFVETQIKISDKADASVSAGLGIHKALAGLTDAGKADSGSEQLYAYMMYKLIGVRIPEMVVTRLINHAIAINFPEKKLKLGFYHEEAQRQQDQTSSQRIKNKNPN